METSPQKAIARAQKYREKGRDDAAAGVLRDAIEAGGEEPSIRMELSRILIAMSEVREAANGLKSFLKANPTEAHQVQDLLAWSRANHHEAGALNEVMAEHHVGRRNFRPAFDALENLDKESLQALLDARLANLKRFLDKKPDSVPRSALPLVYLAALIHEAMGEDPKAIEVYHRIVTAYPKEISAIEERLKGITARHFKSASLRGTLAGIYDTAGSHDRAVEEYVAMVEFDPRLADRAAESLRDLSGRMEAPAAALMGRVKVLKAGGEIGPLADACTELLEKDGPAESLLDLLETMVAGGKEDPRVLILVGEAAWRVGKSTRAVAAFCAAAEGDDKAIRERAREALEGLLEKNPAERSVADALADQAIREGRYEAAVGYLARLPVDADTASMTASRLQTILMSKPDHDGACYLLEKVSPLLDDPHMAALFMRRRIRESVESAREALPGIESIMARVPSDPMIRIAAVEARAAAGDMKGAWKELQGILDGTTGPDPALFHLMVFIGGSSAELCTEITETFSTKAPALAGTPEGQFCLGEMAAMCGQADEAIDAFRNAAAFSPAAAAEVVSTARDLCGTSLSGKSAAALAEMLLDVGDFGGASTLLSSLQGLGAEAGPLLDKIETAYRRNPDSEELRLALASALAAAGRTAHARQLIDEGIKKAGPGAPGALHMAGGDAWIRDGNLGEAVRSYSRAMAQDKSLAGGAVERIDRVLAMDVGHAGAHLARGRGLLLDGNPREGVNSLLTAWSIKPALGAAILKDLGYAVRSFPLEPSVDLARAQIALGQGEVEAATVALGAALKTSPSMAPEVLSRLQAIVRSHPSCAPAHLHAARAWQIRGRFRESGDSYLAAFELEARLVDHVATGLAGLINSFPEEPGPYMAKARMEEARGNVAMAAEAWEAAAFRGAEPEIIIDALTRLAGTDGPNRGRTLLAAGRAAHHMGRTEEAVASFEQAAECSPDLLPDARAGLDAMVEELPVDPSVRLARSRLLLAALEPEGSLPDLEAALIASPSRWKEIASAAAAAASAGADGPPAALLRARALYSGGELNESAELLDQWAPRSTGECRSNMCMLRSRVERRRGDSEAAARWMSEAAGLTSDRSSFVTSLHSETLAAAAAATRTRETAGDRWKALGAMLDLGDVAGAEALARDMHLDNGSGGSRSREEATSTREVLARIACLTGRHGEAAGLLATAPASALKSHVLRRAGRLVEAAACMEEAGCESSDPGLPATEIYRRLAAHEFLGEPGVLEAETRIDFTPDAGSSGRSGMPDKEES